METNDISGALGKLLSDPAALASVMSMAQSIMGTASPTDDSASEPTKVPPEAAPSSEEVQAASVSENEKNTDAASLASLAALAPLLGQSSSKSDPRCALLHALKPYMGHGRSDKIDTLVNMLKIAEIAGGLLGGGKLF